MPLLNEQQAVYLANVTGETVRNALQEVLHGAQDPFYSDGGFDIPETDFDRAGWVRRWKEIGLVDENGPVYEALVVYLTRHPTALKKITRVTNGVVRAAEQAVLKRSRPQ
jgi:hypothetical protein